MSFFKNESGASLVEYALLVALIAVTAVTAIQTLGGNISGIFNKIATEVGTVNANVGA